jgi:hypothetical protein
MSSANFWEISFVITWAIIFIFGGINFLYVSFGGIKKMDRHFSSMINYKWESVNPAECVVRLHKYSFLYTFGLHRPPVDIYMSAWLYFSCLSLTVLWISMFIGTLSRYGIWPMS